MSTEQDTPRVSLSASSLLTSKQAAELLNVKESTLREWTRVGAIPCLRLGPRAIRFTRELLEQWCAEQLDEGRTQQR
jgi:excisionase family DNA binding protein